MPSFLNKLRHSWHKKSPSQQSKEPQQPQEGQQQSGQEPTYSIQPHPATTNDPRDLEPPQVGGGLNSNPEQQAFQTPGPYIPSQNLTSNLEPPKSRDELKARSAELNKRTQ